MALNTKEVIPCEQCPFFQEITSETREEFLKSFEYVTAVLGQTSIDTLWERQQDYIDALRSGTKTCSGYTPIKPGWKRIIKFFEGKIGLSLVENDQCQNSEARGEASERLLSAIKDLQKKAKTCLQGTC